MMMKKAVAAIGALVVLAGIALGVVAIQVRAEVAQHAGDLRALTTEVQDVISKVQALRSDLDKSVGEGSAVATSVAELRATVAAIPSPVVQPKATSSRASGFTAPNLAIVCCNPMSGVVQGAVDGAGNRYRTSAASIEKLSSSGQVLARWTKKIPDVAQAYVNGGTASDQFAHPMDLAIDTQGNIYLSDGCDFCNGFYHVQKISPSGQPLARWALDGVGPGQVHDSRGVTVNAVGNGYLVDAGNGRVVKYAPNGPVLAQFGRRGKGPGELGYPFGIAVDVAGNVYVGDSENKRVQKFSPDGTPVTSFTPGGSFVALDNEGNVYTSDANLGLTKYSPSGQVLDRADGSTGNVALLLGK